MKRVVIFSAIAISALFLCGSAHASLFKKGPWVQRVTSTTAIVRVEVDPPAAVSVEVAPGIAPAGDGGGLPRIYESKEVHAVHAITIANLEPDTHYSYAVKLGAMTKLAQLTTAPADLSDSSFKFLVYGDNRSDDAAHASVVRAMAAVTTDFLIHTGDFVERGDSAAQWQSFFDVEAPLLASRCLYAAVGNHELTDGSGALFLRYFGGGGGVGGGADALNSTFRWGNTRFFLINGVSNFKAGSIDRKWIDKALDDTDTEANLKWRVVVVHHGVYSSGPHGNNARFHEAGIPALFKKHKVDLVLSGHDHVYERGFGSGFAYVISGGGGAPLYKARKPNPKAKKIESTHHYVEMSVSPEQMQLAAVRTDGSIVERCSLSHNARGWDCDPPPPPRILSDGAVSSDEDDDLLSPPPPTESPRSSRCHCEVVGSSRSPSIELVGLFLGLIVTCTRRMRRV